MPRLARQFEKKSGIDLWTRSTARDRRATRRTWRPSTALHGDGGRCSWEQAYRLIPSVQFCTTDNGALVSVSTIALSRKRWPFRVTA